MKKGFNLIELLVSLIIISLIIGIFLQLIIKRNKSAPSLIGSENFKINCSIPNCEVCSSNTECVFCNSAFPCATERIKTQNCSCLTCSNIGCLTCPDDTCTACKPGFGGINCEKCPEGTYSKGGSLALCGYLKN